MLDAVLHELRSAGLLRPDEAAHCNVHIRLDKLLVDVFGGPGRHYRLRVAEAGDLEREHEVALEVQQRFDRFVPRVLGFIRLADLRCIVFAGVDFAPVSGGQLLTGEAERQPVRDLLSFLECASEAVPGSAPEAWPALLESLRGQYREADDAQLVERVLAATDLEELSRRPGRPQHGDFVINNLGVGDDGLLVFDWEDYARIHVPGFDLAVLLGSMVNFEPARLRAMYDQGCGRADGSPLTWLPQACRIIQVDPPAFWRSLPCQLLLFMWLKSRYSPAIRHKVRCAVEALL